MWFYACVGVYVCMHVCICVCVCMRACVYVCMHACVSAECIMYTHPPLFLLVHRVLMTGTMSNAGGSAMRHNLPVTTIVQGFFSSLPKPLDTVEYNLEEEDTKVQLRVFKTGL